MARAERRVPGEPSLSRAIWTVSLPLLLVEIGETAIHVTDTAFLGRIGTTELAALALADTLLDATTVPVVGIAEAMQIVVARRVGQRRTSLVARTFRHGMVMVLGVSTALAVILHLAAPVVGPLLAEDEDVGAAVTDFFRIAAYGVVPNALGLGFAALYIGRARTGVLVTATAVLVSTNVVLSYALILGELGLPRLGIEGAAWAFVGAESAAVVFLAVFTIAKEPVRRRPRNASAATGPTFRPLLRLAPPVAMQALLEGARWLVFFVIVEQMSEEALAWSNLVYACFLIMLIPTYAVAEGTNALISNLIGQGRPGEILQLTARAMWSTYLVTAPMAMLAVLAPHHVLAVFTDDPAAIAGAAPSLRVLAVAMVLVVPAEIWLAAVAGTGATDVAFAIETVLTVVLLACTYAAAITLDLSLAYAWTSVGIAALVSLGLSHWRLMTQRVRHLE